MEKHFQAFMLQALVEAKKAGQAGEIPVGAVIVDSGGSILSSAHNRVISLADPTAHAEILAIREAAANLGNYRLLNTTLYATVEPCPMCAGAMVHARIQRLVFGAADPRWGAAGSLYQLAADQRLNHRMEVVGGVCEDDCRQLMQAFFRTRR
ncbi:MAG: hypothetical protein AMJ54_08690 [Deltaproteobacteria bacterium SG8_13]|nr:MAG: hypothetical protein AMJ54_08690 [Deltaproteobacteria bacterium SG8_13]